MDDRRGARPTLATSTGLPFLALALHVATARSVPLIVVLAAGPLLALLYWLWRIRL